ncbi:MAG TPA: tetratricopeptide repeat protein [Bryobacteraceae bacterium]|nr:tetratricopeptide repeat protein [Bryobacteraceae bacterium]
MKLWLCVTAMVAVSVPPMPAQRQDTTPLIVRGEIVSGRPVVGPLTVELSGNGSLPQESVPVNADNSFEFHSASPGMHELSVIGSGGQVLHRETVAISSATQTLSVHLPDPPNANRSAGNVISLQQLRHKVPPPAQKAFDKGETAITKGDLLQARSSFQEAVSIDPEFADAYNELGGVEAGLKNLPGAAEEFQKAIDLVPEHPMALPNLCIVLAKMERLHEAGQVAKRALQVVPEDGRMHYILATSMLADDASIDAIIAEFERASATVRAAHVVLADLLAKQGHTQEAIQHLETYLATAGPNDPLRAKAEARLAGLRQ